MTMKVRLVVSVAVIVYLHVNPALSGGSLAPVEGKRQLKMKVSRPHLHMYMVSGLWVWEWWVTWSGLHGQGYLGLRDMLVSIDVFS